MRPNAIFVGFAVLAAIFAGIAYIQFALLGIGALVFLVLGWGILSGEYRQRRKRLWYEFFLMTGMREQEVMYTYWSDINLAAGTVRVTHKPDRGWTPKAYKEREIPIPTKLVKSLKVWKAKSDKACNLAFPTAGCNPKLDFLDCLKVVAKRAKLDADDFWLHKFRATFATRCLWAGVDLRTVQQWLGHSDMESTMRYLKPSRSQHVREKVNEIFA